MKASIALSVSALAAGALAAPRNFTTIQPTGYFDPAAATAVQTTYPKYHHTVKGRLVDHMWHIVLDSADFDDAAANEDLQALAKEGILLTNYYALTHPAQPNYLGMVGGDTFGLMNDSFVALPKNISTLAECFEDQRVMWAQYTEDQPFTAYDGWEYRTPGTPDDSPAQYSRAKNPFVAFDSVMSSTKRFVNLKSLKSFYNEQESGHIAQWLMIRPNTINDGSNSNLSTAAKWARDFLEPYISSKKEYHRKLFVLTFAHAATEDAPNRVYTLLLGDIPKKHRGTTDSMYYDHYSIASTTVANYDLPTLGRHDCRSNVFALVNKKCHFHNTNRTIDPSDNYNSQRNTGWLSSTEVPLPIPNLNCKGAGRKYVPVKVKKTWRKASYSYYQWVVNY